MKRYLESKNIPYTKVDFRSGKIVPRPTFHMDILRGDTLPATDDQTIFVFVGGAKVGRQFGGGFHLSQGHETISEGNTLLGKWSTSFQAEIRALDVLCRDIFSRIIRQEIQPTRINIIVSSKAAIQLQRQHRLTTPSLIMVRRLLEVLAEPLSDKLPLDETESTPSWPQTSNESR